jgi:hypothetical protein
VRIAYAVGCGEMEDRIRSGELGELAPPLVLWNNEVAEEALRDELEIIHALSLPDEGRSELLALAYMLGTRYLARRFLDALFREDLQMVKGLGIIDDWVAEGEARGEARGIRNALLALLRDRFGELPGDVVTQVEAADPEWCMRTMPLVATASSLAELGL